MNKIASLLLLFLIAFLIVAGCTTSNQTSDSPAVISQNSVSQNGVAHLSSKSSSGYVAQSSAFTCFDLTGVSETDIASGYLGANIADTRRVTGTITNNCGKIMGFYVTLRWVDPNGVPAYYGAPMFFRLKPGESTSIKFDGIQSSSEYGYIGETNGWTYKIGIGSSYTDLE